VWDFVTRQVRETDRCTIGGVPVSVLEGNEGLRLTFDGLDDITIELESATKVPMRYLWSYVADIIGRREPALLDLHIHRGAGEVRLLRAAKEGPQPGSRPLFYEINLDEISPDSVEAQATCWIPLQDGDDRIRFVESGALADYGNPSELVRPWDRFNR